MSAAILFAAQAAGIGVNYLAMKRQERFDKQAQLYTNLGFELNAKSYDINDLGFQASNFGFELTNQVYEIEQRGSELDMQEQRLLMQQETYQATQQSISDAERLGEVMSTSRAILAARGTAQGTGSALVDENTNIHQYNREQEARATTLNFRKLQSENKLSLMKIHQFGQGIEQAGNRINQIGNNLARTNNQIGKLSNTINQQTSNLGFKNRKQERRTKFLLDTVNMFSSNSSGFGGNK